ncbi:MAG: sigma-70 family RNA polymerase sigma factor, partial [Oscillospiraceae bacterium]|nr:sigma-70 family RNA polymerase sigma factor [Oscillospiraceae bacterium]
MADLKNFSSLVDSYYAKVFYHCVKIVKSNHDSADITQNTFTKAFISLKTLKNADSFGAWIFTICNNEIKLFYRDKEKNISNKVNIENIISKSNSDSSKKYGKLYSAINMLDEKYKNLIILKYFAGFSVKEIAMLAGFDEKLAKSRLYDARKKLENLLSQPKNSAGALNNYNRERKQEIMSTVKVLELGIRVISRMSGNGLNELLKCAKNNEKFSSEVLAELAKVEKGREFTVECGGKLSYDEYIKILAGCDYDVLHEFEDTHSIMRDVAAYLGTGGYIESVETILYVSSIPDTVNWYKKYFGWDGGGNDEGHDIV